MALVCTGAITKRPFVDTQDDDKIKVGHFMTAVGTGDHRYGDAATFVPFFKTMKIFINDPENFDHTKCPENPRPDEKKDK